MSISEMVYGHKLLKWHHEIIAGSCQRVVASSALYSSGCTAGKASRQSDYRCGDPHLTSVTFFFHSQAMQYFIFFAHVSSACVHFLTLPSCSSPARNFKKATRNFACLTRIMTITSVLCSKQWSLLFAPKIMKHRYCCFLIQHSDSAELSQGLTTLGHQIDQTKLDKLFAK
jgi:hypothetical protein